MTKLNRITNNVVKLRPMPTTADLEAIPLARAGEYELTDREVKQLRARIYDLNRTNLAGRRWRTLRDGRLLLVWRIS